MSAKRDGRTGTIYWLGAIHADRDLDTVETLLMIGLADHVDADDECFVGIDTLAEFARVSYNTACRRLAALEAKGRLARTRRRRSDGNLSTYTWRLIRGEPVTSVVTSPVTSVVSDQSPPVVSDQSPPGGDAEVPSGEVPSGEHSPAPPKERANITAAFFEVWWSSYPKKEGKGAAEVKYVAAIKKHGASHADLLAGLERSNRHWERTRTERQFIPLPASWLHQKRWTDTYAASNGRPPGDMSHLGANAS